MSYLIFTQISFAYQAPAMDGRQLWRRHGALCNSRAPPLHPSSFLLMLGPTGKREIHDSSHPSLRPLKCTFCVEDFLPHVQTFCCEWRHLLHNSTRLAQVRTYVCRCYGVTNTYMMLHESVCRPCGMWKLERIFFAKRSKSSQMDRRSALLC